MRGQSHVHSITTKRDEGRRLIKYMRDDQREGTHVYEDGFQNLTMVEAKGWQLRGSGRRRGIRYMKALAQL